MSVLVHQIVRKGKPNIILPPELLQLTETNPAVKEYLTELSAWCRSANGFHLSHVCKTYPVEAADALDDILKNLGVEQGTSVIAGIGLRVYFDQRPTVKVDHLKCFFSGDKLSAPDVRHLVDDVLLQLDCLHKVVHIDWDPTRGGWLIQVVGITQHVHTMDWVFRDEPKGKLS